ncbi:2-keto-4-pentenoate hydratase/2-oxohepta-3-ene-1,7-dioic acid hydratase in catechol pathway [Allocatelliglobosispora scoriae]|uniref:2-keto-4-pentenoate hydratase/2-oxohepta-3-ene-1,7-dioic acid hydratase in catechol pathway n=1 Tax=Allocatelliglobosispora scoriae TaxID=643052 RepID=A0A841BRY4_9ACTN|nr:fumarylacetoacetate hydrolase family protein [Allocatelliglobosispora scoriae]MBB5869560.1 2-keto-4-pentenoate hydratase/2-oxohepta-3-ene-1,7-dioic acid hydratase in catechol pathway [Allocatelliglobosispora scoriae]
MKFMRVGVAGAERPVLLADDRHYDLRGLTADIDGRFLGAGGIELARAALHRGELPETEVAGERIGAPIARPGVVLCVGMNYAAHAAESGSLPPVEPVIFYKAPNTIVGPHDEIRIPRGSTRTDWEVELAVVIGRTARYLDSPQAALECIAGLVTSNDVSEREFQIERSGGQWSKGKSCETFNPLGPYLVPGVSPDELALRSWVNGEARQNSSTKDMIFGVAFLIWHLSQFTVLEPGDLLNTGTPEGVGLSGRFPYLAPGDVVEVEVAGLGRQRTPVTAA